MQLARALNPQAPHENTLVTCRPLDGDEDQAAEVPAAVRDPDGVLNHPQTRELIDFAQPVGLLMTAVLFDGLELVPPYEDAAAAVTYVGEWGAEDPDMADSDGSRWSYGGVARRP